MNVVWSDEARDQLSGIYAALEPRSLKYAIRVVDRLTEASQRLGQFPLLGRVVDRYGFEQVRELVVDGFRLQHHVAPDGIEVLAVFH